MNKQKQEKVKKIQPVGYQPCLRAVSDLILTGDSRCELHHQVLHPVQTKDEADEIGRHHEEHVDDTAHCGNMAIPWLVPILPISEHLKPAGPLRLTLL